MLNDNKIIKVWNMEQIKPEIKGANAYLCFSPVIEYTVTEGYGMILQTEADYIVLGYEGVQVFAELPYAPDEFFIEEAEWHWEDGEPGSEIETMLFVGERLVQVQKESDIYILQFDDFKMYLNPRQTNAFGYFENSVYVPIPGLGRHLTRRCECGGLAEVMVDPRDDFLVCCPKCHRSTYAGYNLREAINKWNNNELDTILDLNEEPFVDYILKYPIHYMALSDNRMCYDDNLYDCSEILIYVGDIYFLVASQRVDYDKNDFYISRFNWVNTELDFNRKIISTKEEPIIFVRKETDNAPFPVLRFQMGERPVLLTADDGCVTIGLSHLDVDDNWIEYDNNVLLNDK